MRANFIIQAISNLVYGITASIDAKHFTVYMLTYMHVKQSKTSNSRGIVKTFSPLNGDFKKSYLYYPLWLRLNYYTPKMWGHR